MSYLVFPYIQLSSTLNQEPTVTTPVLATYNTLDMQKGFSFVPPGGVITIVENGTYVIICGGQVGETINGNVVVDLWLRKNTTNIPNTGVRNEITSSTDAKVVICNAIVSAVVNDTITVYFSVDNTTKSAWLKAYAPVGEPVIPSIILTMFKISN